MAPAPPDSSEVVLAIDPGSEKCGIAVTTRSGELLFRAIVPTKDLVAAARSLVDRYRPLAILCGSGTGSKPLLRDLSAAEFAVPVTPVDESHTSEAARRRYVAERPARGLERLLPRSLRTPSEPYDDYVAVILAERFWTSYVACQTGSKSSEI